MKSLPDDELPVFKTNTKKDRKHRNKRLIQGASNFLDGVDEYGWWYSAYRQLYFHIGTDEKSEHPIHTDYYKSAFIRVKESVAYKPSNKHEQGYWFPKEKRGRRSNSRKDYLRD